MRLMGLMGLIPHLDTGVVYTTFTHYTTTSKGFPLNIFNKVPWLSDFLALEFPDFPWL